MKKNLLRLDTALVVAFLALVASMPVLAAERQCEWTNVTRIVAIGDVHGDYDQMVKCLKATGVIDDGNNWIGGKMHLVQVGDILDRGPDSKKAMDLLINLEQQAKDAGGAVHALIGNHEAFILRGQYEHVYPTEPEPYGGMEAYKKAMAADGKYGKWIRSHNAVIKINDILFLHGGISPRYAAMPLQTINKDVTASIDKHGGADIAEDEDGPLLYRGLTEGNKKGMKARAVFKKKKGHPRGMAEGDENSVKKALDPAIMNYGIRHVVIGHTTVSSKVIHLIADGAVIMIDVGMSKTFRNGLAMCLLIENDKFYAVTPEEKKELPVKRK